MSKVMLLGCDPEVFLKDKDGKFISAHDILPGTKTTPFGVSSGAVQVDGLAAEFNTLPAETSRQFVTNIKDVMNSLEYHAKGNTLCIEPYAVFDKVYFDSLPEEVKELGCNPDWNAWTGQVNPAPDGTASMRTASGHIHIGWCKDVNPHDKLHFEDCKIFIKQLDYFIGLYSLLWDKDNTRRQMYGKAGAFRPKPYGVEYRVMSNQWLKSQTIQTWIFNAVQTATTQLMGSGKTMEDLFGTYAQECIDGNVLDWHLSATGKKVIQSTGLPWPDLKDFRPKKDQENVEEVLKQFRVKMSQIMAGS